MKKVCITILCAIIILFGLNRASAPKEISYYDYASELNLIEIIDSEALSAEALENRNGKLIIERVIGVVDNAETGAGHLLSNENEFISYASVKGISNGNVICTYLIYNPDTNFIDDIAARYDYIIEKGSINQ
jgi:hypothetical protein